MDPARPDEFSKDDPLWDLLDHASKPAAPSPYFARRVLREIEDSGQSTSGWTWLQRFRFTRAWVPVAAAIALVAATGHFWLPNWQSGPPTAVVDDGQQRVSAVLADLDDLIAFEDNQTADDDSAWQ